MLSADAALLCVPCNKRRLGEICDVCDEPLDGEFIGALGRKYHSQCFCCQVCDCELGGEEAHAVKGADGEPLCLPCHEKQLADLAELARINADAADAVEAAAEAASACAAVAGLLSDSEDDEDGAPPPGDFLRKSEVFNYTKMIITAFFALIIYFNADFLHFRKAFMPMRRKARGPHSTPTLRPLRSLSLKTRLRQRTQRKRASQQRRQH